MSAYLVEQRGLRRVKKGICKYRIFLICETFKRLPLRMSTTRHLVEFRTLEIGIGVSQNIGNKIRTDPSG